MLWNGAPTFIASLQKDSNFGQIVEFLPDDDLTVKCAGTGFPPSSGMFCKIGTSEADAQQYEAKDPSGRKVLLKVWYNPETGELTSKGFNVVDKFYSTQTRKVTEEGILTLSIVNEKQDGSTCGFYCKFKKLM